MTTPSTAEQERANGTAQQTPEGSSGSVPSVDAVALARKVEELEKRVADKDRFISELSTEKATLENELLGRRGLQSDEEEPVSHPHAPSFSPDQMSEIVRRNMIIERHKQENQDLLELGLENAIANDAGLLERQGKPLDEALKIAIAKRREVLRKFNKPEPTAVPNGAMGEESSVKATPAPVKQEQQLADEGDARLDRRSKLGL